MRTGVDNVSRDHRAAANSAYAGALLFVVSDWLIFSRLGPYDLAPLPDLLVWPTYYVGQFLIATGVVQTLRRFRR